MGNPVKQIRVKFSDESQEDAYKTREGRIPPQKTEPFKKERRQATSWFRRQFSNQNGEEDDSAADLEFVAAMAAAAYAIVLAEEEGRLGKNKPNHELGRSLTKTTTRKEDSMNRSTFSAKEAEDDDGRVAGASFRRKPSTLDEKMKEESAANQMIKEKGMSSIPSIKKTPTFSDRQSGQHTKGFPNGNITKPADGLKQAYLREQAKMEKIRKRREKMNSKILQWEDEKKVKAKRRMERREKKLEMRRARILQEFREEMKMIDMIASGARAAADEASRSDELKAKEKAKKIQSTAKVRHKCFCF